MFVIETLRDIIKVKASDLHPSIPTIQILRNEINMKYPNRVIMDVGLVIGLYDDNPTKIGHGVCEDSCTHFPISFSIIVFRPFIGEILIGKLIDMNEKGAVASLGFFSNIYIPAYWMLKPSVYENGKWIWIPEYDEDDDDEEEEESGKKTKEDVDNEPTRYEMQIGMEIRVRVKSIHFTRVTTSAKGMHNVTSTDIAQDGNRRRRSSSVGQSDEAAIPQSAMHLLASICEDGLGVTSWWSGDNEEEEEEE